MLVWGWSESRISSVVAAGIWSAAGGGGRDRWNVSVALGVTAMAGLALVATLIISSRRGGLKSPWSRGKRKHALTLHQWKCLFTPDGKLQDGVKFLKNVRSGGVDPSIRPEVWPFLLGVYDLSSSRDERNNTRVQKRKEYKKLRKKCHQLLKPDDDKKELKDVSIDANGEIPISPDEPECSTSEDEISVRSSVSIEGVNSNDLNKPLLDASTVSSSCAVEEDESGVTHVDAPGMDSESSASDSGEELEGLLMTRENDLQYAHDPLKRKASKTNKEDFATWQRIIRLDAVRANGEWISYSPSQAGVSEEKAHQFAKEVGLKDYDHLEPCRVFHAARLVAILEAYAIYDQEIGYCQGMSDLLSPILSVMEEDYEAFWCFVGFMSKARHNFRLDEVGIRRQLSTVSKIIKYKDSHLYKHLEKLQAEDCFFVYRMVVVMFRRELTFEQTLCLWEVMWADQAAIRAGIGRSAWGIIRLRIPPTEDLLLYAIAASVLQKRKLIIEKYYSMDEIMRECNSMAGQLDVWKLLDDAHDLVVTLHDKIQ